MDGSTGIRVGQVLEVLSITLLGQSENEKVACLLKNVLSRTLTPEVVPLFVQNVVVLWVINSKEKN